MTQIYSLSGHLDSASAPPLASDLLERRGAPLCIDASEVTFAGTLTLQVLIAARKQWAEDQQEFNITAPSAGFISAAHGLGVLLPALGAREEDGKSLEIHA